MTGGVANLPLEWFEFGDRPERVRGTWVGPAFRDGKPVTYSTTQDGREIPFRFLQRQATGGDVSARAAAAGATARPVLVMLQGMGVTPASFHSIAPYLWLTHDLVLVDYNSFSTPEKWPTGGVTLRMLAAGVWNVADSLGRERVSFVGSSLGGGLAVLASLFAPRRAERLVLLNPAVYPQYLPRQYRLFRVPILGEILMALTPAERLVEGVAGLGYTTPEKMPDAVRACFVRNLASRTARYQLMDVMRQLPGNPSDMGEYTARFGHLRQPTLILWGRQERLLPPDAGRRLAHDMPNAQLIEFDDLAHLPHDEAPARLGELIDAFLREGLPAAGAVPAAPAPVSVITETE